MKRKYILFATLFIFYYLSATFSIAQNVEVVERDEAKDRYHIRIDGQDYLAFHPDSIRQKLILIDSLKIELKAMETKRGADSSLVETYEGAVEAYRSNVMLKDSVIAQTRSLYTGYRDLYFDYKKAYSEPWLYFHGAVGAALERGGDEDVVPVVMLGFSVKRLSLLGYINNDQSSFLLGINYPIRFNFSFF